MPCSLSSIEFFVLSSFFIHSHNFILCSLFFVLLSSLLYPQPSNHTKAALVPITNPSCATNHQPPENKRDIKISKTKEINAPSHIL